MSFRLTRLSEDEVRRLGEEGISSEDGLWQAVGADFDRGLEELAHSTGIPRNRLVGILVGSTLREASPGKPRWLKWMSRHTPDLLALCAFLFLAVLCLRAGGWLSWLPPPWGLTQRIPIAADDLRKGQVLRTDDLVEVWLNPRRDSFRNPADVEGFRLLRDLGAGSPVRFSDVMREQVIALQDLPRGKAISAGTLAVRWSPYQADAALDPWQVIGREARNPIRQGEVILEGDLAARSK
jgi:hypothetical protein